jgi:hypothetical protein
MSSKRTDFDKILLKEMYHSELKKEMAKQVVSILSNSIINVLRMIRKHEYGASQQNRQTEIYL